MREFLRLFAQYRALEDELETLRAQHARVSQDNILLQDRLDAAREDRERLWTVTQQCLEGERIAYQAHINQAWQRHGGGIPYPDAPHLPASAVPKEQSTEPIGRRGRVLASEAVQQKTSEFIESLARSVGK